MATGSSFSSAELVEVARAERAAEAPLGKAGA